MELVSYPFHSYRTLIIKTFSNTLVGTSGRHIAAEKENTGYRLQMLSEDMLSFGVDENSGLLS